MSSSTAASHLDQAKEPLMHEETIELGPSAGSDSMQRDFSFQTFFDATKSDPLFSHKDVPPQAAMSGARINQKDDHVMSRDEVPLWKRVPVWIPIASWIFFSSAVILQNKYILSDLKFGHPVALTTIHLLFQTIATRALRRYTHLIDGAKELEATGKMTRDVFLKKIVVIAVLFSSSLILSNQVYLYLSVSLIQMIKAITPVAMVLLSFAFKLREPSRALFGVIVAISFGVGVASYGEADFHLFGFLLQLFAIGIESCRLILIQILLQGMSMDPLTSLYYTAPVCLAINSILLLPIEGFAPFYDAVHLVGLPILFLNATMTFALNLSSVAVIGSCSGLVLTLAGVLKDILLIAGSWLILGSTITGIQLFGYGVALSGLVYFKLCI